MIEASAEITVKVGGSFIKVDSAGVHLVGAGVNMNSGGSAGSGSGFSGAMPALPNGIEPPIVESTLPSSITPIMHAEMVDSGSLMIELCNCGMGGICKIHG